jgi:hypothetical protein
MTLQKETEELNRDNRLITASSAIISIKKLSAQNPSYVQIGPTIGGLDIRNICEHEFFGDDGTTGPIGALVLNEEMRLRFALSQAGIYNLAVAINADPGSLIITQPVPSPPSDGSVALAFGGRRDTETYEIKAEIKKPSEKTIREYIFYIAIPVPDLITHYENGRIVSFECGFRLLMDISKDEGKRYFSVTDYYDSEYGELAPPDV